METEKLIKEVKLKREFSGLPDSIVGVFLERSGGDVKETRAILRKFFGVFLTNKVLRGKDGGVLKSHISSKGRDYDVFYDELFENFYDVVSVVDLGCGGNGFSYGFLKEKFGNVNYLGIEAAGQLVENMNEYFKDSNFKNAQAIWLDLFEKEKVLELIAKQKGPKVIMMLQVIDALENLKNDYSKEFLLGLRGNLSKDDAVVISMPLKSISGRKKFEARRTWLINFLKENFEIKKEKEIGNEKIIILKVS